MQKKIIHFECSNLEKVVRESGGYNGPSQEPFYKKDVQQIKVLKEKKI